jgi:hypothetical protein
LDANERKDAKKQKEDGTSTSSFCKANSLSVNTDLLLALGLLLELNLTVNQSEQRVIGADANVVTGMHGSASLSDDDIAGADTLTVRLLNAKALRFAVTAVLGRTDTLLVSKEL